MPLYYLLVDRRMDSVLGVHEHRRGFDRSISGCVCLCVTPYPVNFLAVRKNITWKNGKEKQNHLPCNIMAFGKNIKWVRGEGDGQRFFLNGVGEENQDFKNGGG